MQNRNTVYGGEWLRKTLLLLLQISRESLHFVIWAQVPAEDSNL